MFEIANLYRELTQVPYVSGKEYPYFFGKIPLPFSSLGARIDGVGNLWISKKASDPLAKNILFEAHLDEIGFCVEGVTENGFLHALPCGGFDRSILPGTEFTVHGKRKVRSIAISVPPHLSKIKDDASKKEEEGIYLDCGFASKKEAFESVSPGDSITYASDLIVQDGAFIGHGLDNKASVIALLLALEKVSSPHNLHFLFSTGEETGKRGICCADFPCKMDLAFVFDVGFGLSADLDETKCIQMGKGPSVSLTDTLSRTCEDWVIKIAQSASTPLQTVCEPGGTGTNATALQLLQGGIPTAVISLPLRYMHTASETVLEKDIFYTADLVCAIAEAEQLPQLEVSYLEHD